MIDPKDPQQDMSFGDSSDGAPRPARIAEILADRFVLEQLAGRGGMGEVYRAQDRRTGQPVAVKILRDPQPSMLARFEREARILAELAHPLIVRYVAHGALHTGEPFLAMEWLDGQDLAARLEHERLGATDSLALAVAIAEALAVLHARGIVHRDLKPSNVFLIDGRLDGVKLLDFGLARAGESTRMTSTGAMLGTIDYMAPEQARGDEALDARVDLFALGCVLFECLTGERPFSAEHPTAVLTKLLFEEAPRVADRRPGVPAELDALVARMLAKRADERPRDARAAADALRAVLDLRPAWSGGEPTLPLRRPTVLTDSERRMVAVILVAAAEGGPGGDAATAPFELEAAAHGGAFERLVDGAGAVLLSGAAVATDLAGQAARCALALRRHAAGRPIALAIGRSATTGRLAVGPAIDQAVRLLGGEGPQAPGAADALVTVDETTAGLLETRFDVRRHGGAFVLHGERAVSEVRTLLGRPTPCVGRGRELRMLAQLFEQCEAERAAQAVLVTAPAGVGKSRLAQEYLQGLRARAAPPAIWIARGTETSAGSGFGLARQVLRSACGILDGEPAPVRRDKLRARVAEAVPEGERRRVTEFLGEVLGAPSPDEDSLPLAAARTDAQLMNEQVRAAFLDFLAAECARHPVVILLEDLHWGDRPTVQVLDRALRDLHDRPLLVLALARPEVHDVFPRLWAERASQEIRLRALDRRAVAQLARHVLGDGVGAETLERLEQLSEGNAFHLEELIRATAEPKGGELPGTVVAMVQSRLGALDGESRRLLRAASVFGEAFWAGGAAVLVGGDPRGAVVRARIAELVEQELLVRRKDSRFPGEHEFAFRHALLWEGAYAMLTDEDRALGHRLAGAWLEGKGEQDALLLAAHFEKGADGERAGRHYLRAVEQASTAGDTAAAIAYANRGLSSGVAGELRSALLGALCEAYLFQLDRVSSGLPRAEEVVRVARRGSAPWIQGMFIIQTCALLAGDVDRFQETTRELLEVEPAPAGAVPLALSFMGAAHMLDQLGAIAQADAVLARLGALARDRREEPLVQCYWHSSLGMRAATVGEDPARGLSHTAEAAAIAAAIGHHKYTIAISVFQGMQRWLLGAAPVARQILEQTDLSDEQYALASAWRPFVLAWLLADQGALDEARAWAARLVQSGQARGLVMDEGRGHWALAEVLRRAGELPSADAAIGAAFATLGAVCPLDVPGLHATRAALRLAQGRPAEAVAEAAAGLARYEAIGACSFFARGAFLRVVHAESLEAAGRHEDARAAIAGARERLLANADKIAEPLARARFLDGVPEHRRTLALARQWLDQGA